MDAPKVELDKGGERTRAQCERILNAAQKCFVEHGFHAASMGDIAKTAGMSPGLIYRYFDSKSTIIVAIIERQILEARTNIRALNAGHDMAASLANTFTRWRDGDPSLMNAALFAEMSAEATRNPALTAAMQASDGVLREELGRWLAASVAQTSGKELAPEAAAARGLCMQLFIEGMIIRAIREPGIDTQLLAQALRQFVDTVLAPPA
jgi:AcrR family transcriptional regulator